jgi:hypothetical protein
MVVVSLEPSIPFKERAGMATSTRKTAAKLWGGALPRRDPARLVRELYAAENAGLNEPSGSQDMIGLIYPGASRLDYDANVEDGVFPAHIESTVDPGIVDWLERVLLLVPVAPRPQGYNPSASRISIPAGFKDSAAPAAIASRPSSGAIRRLSAPPSTNACFAGKPCCRRRSGIRQFARI